MTLAKKERWLGRLTFLTTTGLLLLVSASVEAGGQTPASAPTQRVLVLYSDERVVPAVVIVDDAIRATFTAADNLSILTV